MKRFLFALTLGCIFAVLVAVQAQQAQGQQNTARLRAQAQQLNTQIAQHAQVLAALQRQVQQLNDLHRKKTPTPLEMKQQLEQMLQLTNQINAHQQALTSLQTQVPKLAAQPSGGRMKFGLLPPPEPWRAAERRADRRDLG